MAGRWPQARERLETQREEQEAVLTKELPVGPLGSRDRALFRFVSEGGYKMQTTKAGPKPKILKEKG